MESTDQITHTIRPPTDCWRGVAATGVDWVDDIDDLAGMTTDSYNHAGQLQDSSCVSAGQATGAVRIN